jgi:RNA polymerase sigma factor (sigma-70 family)
MLTLSTPATTSSGWTRRKQYRPGTNPRAWLLSIARNQLMEYHRRNSRDNRHLRELIRREILRRADQFEPATSHPDSERLAALKECMLSLSDDQRELLDLVHGKGLQTSDAAEIMGVSPPTCRQRLSRLQRMLRECALKRLGEPA